MLSPFELLAVSDLSGPCTALPYEESEDGENRGLKCVGSLRTLVMQNAWLKSKVNSANEQDIK